MLLEHTQGFQGTINQNLSDPLITPPNSTSLQRKCLTADILVTQDTQDILLDVDIHAMLLDAHTGGITDAFQTW